MITYIFVNVIMILIVIAITCLACYVSNKYRSYIEGKSFSKSLTTIGEDLALLKSLYVDLFIAVSNMRDEEITGPLMGIVEPIISLRRCEIGNFENTLLVCNKIKLKLYIILGIEYLDGHHYAKEILDTLDKIIDILERYTKRISNNNYFIKLLLESETNCISYYVDTATSEFED